MLLTEQVEAQIIPLLQETVQFVIDKKVIKKGKLLLFSMKGFYLTFTIVNDKGEPKIYEIPYPFKISNIHEDSPELTLDYTLNEISNDNAFTYIKLTNVKPIKKSKFFNTTVNIEVCKL